MKVYNRSRKIIGIAGEPLLPGESRELPPRYERHPAIVRYLALGFLAEEDAAGALDNGEKERIAAEAVARYQAEQERLAAEQAAREKEIAALKTMKKAELLTKAIGMELEVKDDDTADELREKIAAAIRRTGEGA